LELVDDLVVDRCESRQDVLQKEKEEEEDDEKKMRRRKRKKRRLLMEDVSGRPDDLELVDDLVVDRGESRHDVRLGLSGAEIEEKELGVLAVDEVSIGRQVHHTMGQAETDHNEEGY
jgi:hypothetical protein